MIGACAAIEGVVAKAAVQRVVACEAVQRVAFDRRAVVVVKNVIAARSINDRRQNVSHRDGDHLRHRRRAVEHRDLDVVGTIGAGIGRIFEVRRNIESQNAGDGVDGEFAIVGRRTRNAVDERVEVGVAHIDLDSSTACAKHILINNIGGGVKDGSSH